MAPQPVPQIDGNADLNQQQLQLQTIETFFQEVTGYQAGDDLKNNVTVRDSSAAPASLLQLRLVQGDSGADVLFEGTVFVSGVKQKVAAFRAA